MICTCKATAYAIFNYNTSQGRQRVPLCRECADVWWNGRGKERPAFKNTPAGLSLSIEPVTS